MNREVFNTMIEETMEVALDIKSYARTVRRMQERGRDEMVDVYIDALSESCSELNELIVGLKTIRSN